jgi:methionyl aminopeptidase
MAILKQADHLPLLRHSGKILVSTLKLLEKHLKPGVTGKYLDDLAIAFVRDHGGELPFLGYEGFPNSLCLSVNNEVNHGLASADKIIPENSVVKLDFGVIYQGLYSDSAVTIILGDAGERARRMCESNKAALWAGIKAVKAGKRIGDIGAAVDAVAKRDGFGNVLALGGHGLGYSVHDAPFIAHAGKVGKGPRLFENQIIAIEPLFSLGSGEVDFDDTSEDGWTVRTSDNTLASHFEHTMIVTKEGCEVITDIPDSELLK